MFERVAIVGPGLIGGSMGMAIRRRGLAEAVVGVGRRESSLHQALEAGAVDEVTLDLQAGVRNADLIVLATPIRALGELAGRVAGAAKPGAIVTDVASTKVSVIETIVAALEGRGDLHYVPTHPMAGSENRGPTAAHEDLFEGSVCIFATDVEAPRESFSPVRMLWERLGAVVRFMSPAEHDRLVARISHLPHLVAAGLIVTLSVDDFGLSGGGLLDTTRVASGDAALWRDILETNSADVAASLDDYAAVLRTLRDMLAHGEMDRLEAFLQEAKDKRDGLLRRRASFDRSRRSARHQRR